MAADSESCEVEEAAAAAAAEEAVREQWMRRPPNPCLWFDGLE
jgi:hypothetical protein